MHKPLSLISLLSLLFYLNYVLAIPIDNGVEGEPEIECGAATLTVNFNTRNNFEGHVYVKGLYDHEECRSDSSGRQVAGIELPLDSCNVERSRSLNPRGVFVTAVVVITFHPKFITKIDRAYRIQCFYMEADKTVSTQIEVSEMTTAFQTQVVPMPVCRYEILEGGPSGTPVRYAMIGDQVYHKWTCDSETTDTFCALVHSCVVDDGKGDTVQILNEDGCALDKYLLNNLEYPTDLMAGQEAHVYKYADRSELYYQCQISITIKEPNSECPRPQCSEPQGFGAVKSASAPAPEASPLSPRLLKKRSVNYDNTLDVSVGFSAIDISEEDSNLSAKRLLPATTGRSISPLHYQSNGTICITSHDILLITLFSAILAVACILFIAFITYFNNNNNSKS
ncbi:cuticlin 1 precursor, putative [Brugia malayi]|uniref:Bm5274 n=2 Tax=Brugia TaxID=6278 RepID=A0A0H5S905_BRUMA|nr:cuticlin 1 precursor, putative [Brugia malayi]CRZ24849.1 Bm5274 [Brugia malayi]VIO93287.1 cuticlin 1 precursor, putative [Brugia malayi]